MSASADWFGLPKTWGTIVPICPICLKPLAKRPVSFVNGRAWCRACYSLMNRIQRMRTYLELPPLTEAYNLEARQEGDP